MRLNQSDADLRPPKGFGEFLLYLDFDGVLHHENVQWKKGRGPHIKAAPEFVLFQYAPLLVQILEPYPKIKIVLSTSWVRTFGYTKAVERLPKALQTKCIGATFHSSMNPYTFQVLQRGMQVCDDVARRKPLDWVALDDDYLGWPSWAERNFIQTDLELGFTAAVPLGRLQQRLHEMDRSNG